MEAAPPGMPEAVIITGGQIECGVPERNGDLVFKGLFLIPKINTQIPRGEDGIAV